jgi:hypothetical protein
VKNTKIPRRTRLYNRSTKHLIYLSLLIALAGCRAKPPAVEDLSGRENLSLFKLHSMRGTRDGDRLEAQAVFSDSSSILMLEMHFAVGSPTTLASGTWRWTRNNQLLTGSMRSRSVTFLGGQDGPPSVGGSFELAGSDGAPAYLVRIPVTQLQPHGS